MTRLEFEKVMQAVGMDEFLNSDGTYFNGFKMDMSKLDNYSAIIVGKIPLEVAQTIHDKYPNNEYRIIVEGTFVETSPKKLAVDDEYVKKMKKDPKKYISCLDLQEREEREKSRLEKRSDKNKYIRRYEIETKEGLIIFLTEMKDYLLRKNNLPETEVKRYDEILAKTTASIIEEINPTISIDEWKQRNKKDENINNKSNSNVIIDSLRNIIKEAASDFDKTANPFLNKDLIINDPATYIKDLYITGNTEENNCGYLTILDINNKIEGTEYFRMDNGLWISGKGYINEKEYLRVDHEYIECDEDK